MSSRFQLTRRRVLWTFGQAGVVVAGLLGYFWVRGLTEGAADLATDHALDIVALEQSLGIHFDSSLQRPLAASDAWATLGNWIYIFGHWPVIVVTMAWLAVRHSDVFLRLRDAMLVSGAMGLAVFAWYPVAPPRLAGLGLVDTVTERSRAYRVLQPPAFVDQYAAMPSRHLGWNLLIGMAVVSAASTLAVRIIGCLMPWLMAVSVVITGNHFVLDVFAGAAFVLVGHGVALVLERRRERRRRLSPQRTSTQASSEGVGVSREHTSAEA